MRLIDADPIMQDLEEWMKDPNRDPDAKSVVDHMGGIIRTSPTVDAEPVRHAHWEKYDVYGDINFRCSACKKARFHNGEMIQKYRYCYNCGARMDEEEET